MLYLNFYFLIRVAILMKKIKYLLLLILFIPLNTFAITQNDKYFNLEFPSTFHDDFTNLQFGANTDLKDVLDELMSYHNNYKNLTNKH